MIQGLVMEFDKVPENTAETLAELRASKAKLRPLGADNGGLGQHDAFDGAPSPCRALLHTAIFF